MSRTGILFALFCLGVVALYFLAARRGYSPFAARGPGFFYAGGRSGGPQHK